jgi:hypothetical protein
MEDVKVDANTEVVKGAVNAGDFNVEADKFLDSLETSSGSKDANGEVVEKKEDTGVDQSKKANLQSEVDKAPTVEEKLAKIAEILGDDKDAVEAYIKQHGYHKDPAWQKLLEKSRTPAIDDETKNRIAEFNKVTSSPDYIRAAMKTQGYTDEAIDKALVERGFDIQPKGMDDFQLVAKTLGIDTANMDENTKAVISDVARIADVIFKDRMAKVLPNALKPIEEQTTKIAQRDGAAQFMNTVKGTLEKEGVLTLEDIAPHLDKFMDENPNATQQDVLEHFKEINHTLTIERLKSGKKAIERGEQKKGNRPLSKESSAATITVPKKTGEFGKDADALLDALNVQ